MRTQTKCLPSATDLIVGGSSWATRIRREIELVAQASMVLVTGPSGTGKELIARALHAAGDRSNQPFVPVDCAAASDTLFASQLFGHEKGAFTGATFQSLGAFRAAERGTIFLDEIGELDLQLQAKLLRTLQQRVVVPIGGLQEFPIDVRVVAATNRDLQQEVAGGRFREDLFYRLHVVSLETQSLCEHCEDIPLLVQSILARLEIQLGLGKKRLSDEALQVMCNFHWPGNVRQLGNVLERAALFSGTTIGVAHLPQELLALAVPNVPESTHNGDIGLPHACDQDACWPSMEDVERQHLVRTLQRTNFNQTAAANLLKLDRNAVRRMAQRLGVSISAPKPR